MFLLETKVRMIIDVANKRKFKFIFKYGILKTLILTITILAVNMLCNISNLTNISYYIDIFVRLMLSIIPSIFIGLGDYEMYKDTIEEKNVKKNPIKYVIIAGLFGWGLYCSILSSKFYPFDLNNLKLTFLLLPGFALVIENLVLIFFNKDLILDIYNRNIKGKNITDVKRKKNKNRKQCY